MKTHADIVIVGGGAVGASILYGLTKHGASDVVLLERSKLTAGSTWHAAGLLVSYSRSTNVSRMLQESIDVYREVEAAAGTPVGLYQVGQLRVANTQERMDEFLSYIGTAASAGIEARIVTPEEIAVLHPMLKQNPEIKGGLLHPNDGYINPADITMALVKLAREKGGKVEQDCEALSYERTADGWKVTTNKGEITARQLVFATGNYARENARRVGLDLPCIPILHQYWTTEPLPELLERRKQGLPQYPILRDEDYGGYLREDTGGLQFGPYELEKDLHLWAVDGVPKDFGMDLMPEDFAAVEAQWQVVMERVPAIATVGIKSNTRGPFQMTPDGLPLVGPAPGMSGLWLAEGVPGGLVWGGAIGERLARWILQGTPGMDLSEIDSRRFGSFVSKRWTMAKVHQTWGTHMKVHYPGEDRPAARPAKTAPSYDLLTAKGAVWTVLDGWEFPRWFAPTPDLAVPEHSFRRTRHMEWVQAEVRAVREAAGLIDMAPMTKFTVTGPGAADWLDGLFANKLPAVGRVGLTVMCNPEGGIVGEYTVIRHSENDFYLVSTPAGETTNWDDLTRLLPADGVTLTNVSEQMGVLALSGPKARDILQPLTDCDLSNAAFPWLTAQRGEVGYARDVTLVRVAYTGELGWEIHHPMSYNRHLVDLLCTAGEPQGMKLFGVEAIESLRLDKGYRSIHRELAWDITPLEAGLGRMVKDKPFLGREAMLAKGQTRRIVTLKLPAGETSVLANEAVYRDGTRIGRVTSGGWSYHFGHDIALALIEGEAPTGSRVMVHIHNEMREAEVVGDALYDPQNQRPRM